jgi:hypothetical protein
VRLTRICQLWNKIAKVLRAKTGELASMARLAVFVSAPLPLRRPGYRKAWADKKLIKSD